MKSMIVLIAAAAMLTAPAAKAASLALRDGEYSCSLSPEMVLGSAAGPNKPNHVVTS